MEFNKKMNKTKIFNVLCLSGGGIKGIIELGALHYLDYDMSLLKNINVFVGTSIGAVIAVLLNLGFAPIEIFDKVLKVENFINFDMLNFFSFKKAYGLIDIQQFLQHVEKAIKEKLPKIPTLKELHNLTKKRFACCIANYSQGKEEYADYETYPNSDLMKILEATCSLPIVFNRVNIGNNIYVDGGIVNNFPIEYASKFGNVIGLRTVGISNGDNILSYVHRLFSIPIHKIERMQFEIIELKRELEYYKSIVTMIKKNPNILSKRNDLLEYKNEEKNFILELETTTQALDFPLSKDKKMELFLQGYNIAKIKFLEKSLEFEW